MMLPKENCIPFHAYDSSDFIGQQQMSPHLVGNKCSQVWSFHENLTDNFHVWQVRKNITWSAIPELIKNNLEGLLEKTEIAKKTKTNLGRNWIVQCLRKANTEHSQTNILDLNPDINKFRAMTSRIPLQEVLRREVHKDVSS